MRVSAVFVVIAVAACGQKAVAPAAEQAKPTEPAVQTEPAARPNQEQLRAATKRKIALYAFEAFPQWAVTHPDRACPDRLADLNEFMDDRDGLDAWGQPLIMLCGAAMPPHAKGIAIISKGADGKQGTDDDINSWE